MKIYLTLLFITLQWYLHAQNVVINEIYGGGGISGAAYTNDFVELYNNGSTPVSLTGYSVQYASATGSNWSSVALGGTIYPQGYYLIQLTSSGTVGQPLPTPDVIGTINMNSSTGGKVVLVNLSTTLPSSTCPTGPVILDLVGYGSAGCYWGTDAAPSPSAIHSIARQNPGQNSLQNGDDFTTGAPSPHGASRISQFITFEPLVSRTYGDPQFDLTPVSSSGLPITLTSSNPGVANVDVNTISIISAGQTVITASQPGDAFYEAAPNQSQTLVINKAALQAYADNKTMIADESIPALTISFAGFKGTDNASLIDTPPLATTTATASSPPGTYSIDLSSGLDNNYDLTLTNGILTILDPAILPNVYILNPSDGAMAVGLTFKATAKILTGATTYVIQLSPYQEFSSGVIEKSGTRTQQFAGLSYGTKYFLRVKTNLSDMFGKKTSFTTGPPEQFTFVTSPANNAIHVGVNPKIVSTLITGASSYTIELSTTSDFSGPTLTKIGSRSQVFQGLSLSTRYYTRVKTDLSENWGPVKSFTTGDAISLSYVISPANNAENVSWHPVITVNHINATTYSLQVCPLEDFSSDVFEMTSSTNRFAMTEFLSYNTRYFTRVKSNLTSEWGALKSFTTGNPLSFAYVSAPRDEVVNQNYGLKLTVNLVPGATTYIIELNTDPGFNPSSAITQSSSARAFKFDLQPNTKYFNRVKTDLYPESWGTTRSFTTGTPQSLAYVVSPKNGGSGAPLDLKVYANPVGAASRYTIELSPTADFSGPGITQISSSRVIQFTGLLPATTYYTRVQTNLASGLWGPVNHFTTASSPSSLSGGRFRANWEGDTAEDSRTNAIGPSNHPYLTIFPNPFSIYFNLIVKGADSDVFSLIITNQYGSVVEQGQVPGGNMMEFGETWPDGLYIIKVSRGFTVMTQRVLKAGTGIKN